MMTSYTELCDYLLPPNWSIVAQKESKTVFFYYEDPTDADCYFSQWESPLRHQKAALISPDNKLRIYPSFQVVCKPVATNDGCAYTLEFVSDCETRFVPPHCQIPGSKRVVEITNAPTLPYGWQTYWIERYGRTFLFFRTKGKSSQYHVPEEMGDCSKINLVSPRLMGLPPLPRCWGVRICHNVDHTGVVHLTFTDHKGTHTENRPTGTFCIDCVRDGPTLSGSKTRFERSLPTFCKTPFQNSRFGIRDVTCIATLCSTKWPLRHP